MSARSDARVNAHDGIRLGRDVQSAQRGPEQGARRDEPARGLGPRHLERIADEDRRAAAEAAAEKEIEAYAVGGGDRARRRRRAR